MLLIWYVFGQWDLVFVGADYSEALCEKHTISTFVDQTRILFSIVFILLLNCSWVSRVENIIKCKTNNILNTLKADYYYYYYYYYYYFHYLLLILLLLLF